MWFVYVLGCNNFITRSKDHSCARLELMCSYVHREYLTFSNVNNLNRPKRDK